jgi:hypothetical protein
MHLSLQDKAKILFARKKTAGKLFKSSSSNLILEIRKKSLIKSLLEILSNKIQIAVAVTVET